MQALQVRIASLGGRARKRRLSPERRSEIASWARFIRKQKENGELAETEIVKRITRLL
jgi:hypothetical protein